MSEKKEYRGFTVPGAYELLSASGFDFTHIDFEAAHDEDEDFNEWFDTDGKDYSGYLYHIGRDGAGGLFALWNPKTLTSGGECLVVYLGSDGDFGVAAENMHDFLILLANEYILYDLIVDGEKIHFSSVMDEDLLPGVQKIRSKYIDWLKDNFNITEIDQYPEVLERAAEHLEDFEFWCEERIGQ